MASARFQISGLRELGEALKALGDDIGSKIARQAVNAGAQVIKKQAQRLAPVAPGPYRVTGNERTRVKGKGGKRQVSTVDLIVQPGNIAKNIVVKRVKDSKLTVEYVVAVRGKKQHGFASHIAALQEFGTVKQSPQPFMRPAFEQEKGFAVQTIRQKMIDRIDKANKG